MNLHFFGQQNYPELPEISYLMPEHWQKHPDMSNSLRLAWWGFPEYPTELNYVPTIWCLVFESFVINTNNHKQTEFTSIITEVLPQREDGAISVCLSRNLPFVTKEGFIVEFSVMSVAPINDPLMILELEEILNSFALTKNI